MRSWIDPFDEMRRIRREIDRMFNEFFSAPRLPEIPEGWREPICDFRDTEDALILTLEMPGVKKDEIEIKATKDTIEIKSETKKLVHEEKEGFYRRERSYRGFYRKLTLPCEIIPEKIEATYEDGILEIKMPKKEKKKKEEEIRVEVK
ncbi:MAG: Hsp20/alpha crystallin family protein [Candidatus Parvarchaeota archaeon]|nr:Hsp20/alpha crystallin family protein [Candidatus Jingweiarchaeum tengchongense]MCW1297908.1 Hsp20/alpha crystallin family protein [Candidatus Jingweiarchaeum tengchongense]MCW1300659.1 Hsp20/alpha crystallin family protein [Candidatus Jingweiarchaeum tengchongense]MCW1304653.1 Hsp20/alpha crystallin family protein [Candidatus Jingweiarchaeum tengchongense]MCW1306046.1 Hsp20/alpha crystallin family protein [Candidatus Jingweiarchaeum tengchongense]